MKKYRDITLVNEDEDTLNDSVQTVRDARKRDEVEFYDDEDEIEEEDVNALSGGEA